MPRKCNFPGCQHKHHARGYCRNHWSKFMRDIKTGKMEAFGDSYQKKQGILKCLIQDCDGKYFSVGYCQKHYRRMKNNRLMVDSRIDSDRSNYWMEGPNNPNWNGGVSQYQHHGVLKKVRIKKLESVNYKCQACGAEAVQIHHIDRTKSNHDISNLMALCTYCHHHIFHTVPKSTNATLK